MEILITSKTAAGDKALEQHIKEVKNLNFKQRVAFKSLGYTHTVIDDKNVSLKVKNPFVKRPYFLASLVEQIKETLTENGAVYDLDFIVTINEEI